MNKYFLLTMIALGTALTSCNKEDIATIDKLNTDLTQSNNIILANGVEISRLNSEIAGFVVDLDLANGQIGELTSTVNQLEVEIEDAIFTNEELTNVNAELQATLDAANEQIAILEAAALVTAAQIADLQATLQSIEDDAAAAAAVAAAAQALIDNGQVLFAFDNGEQVFKADGTPILLNYDGEITDDAFESHEGWVQKQLDIYQGIVDTYTKLLG